MECLELEDSENCNKLRKDNKVDKIVEEMTEDEVVYNLDTVLTYDWDDKISNCISDKNI